MKTLLIAISILFAASVICAAEPSPAPRTEKPAKPPEQADWLWECASLGKLAEQIMTDRQNGISRATMIGAVQSKYLFEYMIIEAYDVPRYSTDRMQKKSIEEFRDRIYQECVEATRLE